MFLFPEKSSGGQDPIYAQVDKSRKKRSVQRNLLENPDERSLLERSAEDPDQSLDELDQLVHEDVDMLYPSLPIYSNLSNTLSDYEYLHNFTTHNPNYTPKTRVEDILIPGKADGSMAGVSSAGINFPHYNLHENMYLRPSCHAHSEFGPAWKPFHEYDPVYVPHHDPVGFQRRFDKESSYITSPRQNVRHNPYESVHDARHQSVHGTRQVNTGACAFPSVPVPRGNPISNVVPHDRTFGVANIVPPVPVRIASRTPADGNLECRLQQQSVSCSANKERTVSVRTSANSGISIPGHEYTSIDAGIFEDVMIPTSKTKLSVSESDSSCEAPYEMIEVGFKQNSKKF